MIAEIKNIEQLVPLSTGKKIAGQKLAPLTAPGENYGSLMLSVVITVETPKGNEEIHVVAKMVPPNPFIQEMFNTPVTFRNEIAFYKNMVPLLQDFQREHGVEKVIDYFPKYYGSRLNLRNDNGEVDADGALVLENLKVLNYGNLERTEGVDFDAAELILKDLALFHAVPLALKLQKPDVFEKEFKPYLDTMQNKEEIHNFLKKRVLDLIDRISELEPLKERILTGIDRAMVQHEPREPFATMAHNDCWTNNNMLKFEGDKPVNNKLVDFQICSYGSPARDIVFFLFSSVKNHVLKQHYEDLVKRYHQIFISVLKELHCDTSPFSIEALLEEINEEARNSQFGHVVFMLMPIYAQQEDVKEVAELSPQDIKKAAEPSEQHEQKFIFVVKEFLRRNWI